MKKTNVLILTMVLVVLLVVSGCTKDIGIIKSDAEKERFDQSMKQIGVYFRKTEK